MRSIYYVLLPLSLLVAWCSSRRASSRRSAAPVTATTLEGAKQVAGPRPGRLAGGDQAARHQRRRLLQRQLRDPFENPNGVHQLRRDARRSSLIPAALHLHLGRMVGRQRQGWAIYAAMCAVWVALIAVVYAAEQHGTPASMPPASPTTAMPARPAATSRARSSASASPAPRFGRRPRRSTSNGSVNGSMESFTGLGQLIPMSGMATGEVIFGGVGSGLYRMLLLRHPGRVPRRADGRAERPSTSARRSRRARSSSSLARRARSRPDGALDGRRWRSPHHGAASLFAKRRPQGFSETLYAYLSQANNNGSAFAGYTGFVQPHAPGNVGRYGITFADLLGGVAMLSSRFVADHRRPGDRRLTGRQEGRPRRARARCAPTTRLSSVLLLGVIILVGALTFFPALLLGPVVRGPDRRGCSEVRPRLILNRSDPRRHRPHRRCSASPTRSSSPASPRSHSRPTRTAAEVERRREGRRLDA